MNELLVSNAVPLRGPVNQHMTVPLYAKQPFRSLLFIALILESFALRLPYKTVVLSLFGRWSKPVPQWSLVRALLVSMLRHVAHFRVKLNFVPGKVNKTTLPRISAKKGATAIWVQPVHRQHGLSGEVKVMFDAGGCTTTRIPAYWYGEQHQATEQSRDAGPDERVVLFFHGGGYRELSAAPDSPVIANLRLVLSAAKRSGKENVPRRALALEYRLTSDGVTFPAILADALAAWTYLVRQLGFKPQNITLLGDSAGGNLVLALTRYLRDERPMWKELGLPANSAVADGLILVSPWTDISGSICYAGPSSSGFLNASTDYLTADMLDVARVGIVAGLPATALYSAYISSVTTGRSLEDDLFDGFPRTLCIYGGKEIFRDEILAFAQHFSAAADAELAGKLTIHEAPYAVHDYPVIPIGFAAERKQAREAVAEWL